MLIVDRDISTPSPFEANGRAIAIVVLFVSPPPEAEFFNALFVIPRSVGFIAHFMEQKKNDEGLFRLPDELLFVRKKK